MKFGHRGGNHTIKYNDTHKNFVVSQNHFYTVKSLDKTNLEVLSTNLLDNTIEGVECKKDKVFSVQYHPESSPGPNDSYYLFNQFMELIEKWKEMTYIKF